MGSEVAEADAEAEAEGFASACGKAKPEEGEIGVKNPEIQSRTDGEAEILEAADADPESRPEPGEWFPFSAQKETWFSGYSGQGPKALNPCQVYLPPCGVDSNEGAQLGWKRRGPTGEVPGRIRLGKRIVAFFKGPPIHLEMVILLC